MDKRTEILEGKLSGKVIILENEGAPPGFNEAGWIRVVDREFEGTYISKRQRGPARYATLLVQEGGLSREDLLYLLNGEFSKSQEGKLSYQAAALIGDLRGISFEPNPESREITFYSEKPGKLIGGGGSIARALSVSVKDSERVARINVKRFDEWPSGHTIKSSEVISRLKGWEYEHSYNKFIGLPNNFELGQEKLFLTEKEFAELKELGEGLTSKLESGASIIHSYKGKTYRFRSDAIVSIRAAVSEVNKAADAIFNKARSRLLLTYNREPVKSSEPLRIAFGSYDFPLTIKDANGKDHQYPESETIKKAIENLQQSFAEAMQPYSAYSSSHLYAIDAENKEKAQRVIEEFSAKLAEMPGKLSQQQDNIKPLIELLKAKGIEFQAVAAASIEDVLSNPITNQAIKKAVALASALDVIGVPRESLPIKVIEGDEKIHIPHSQSLKIETAKTALNAINAASASLLSNFDSLNNLAKGLENDPLADIAIAAAKSHYETYVEIAKATEQGQATIKHFNPHQAEFKHWSSGTSWGGYGHSDGDDGDGPSIETKQVKLNPDPFQQGSRFNKAEITRLLRGGDQVIEALIKAGVKQPDGGFKYELLLSDANVDNKFSLTINLDDLGQDIALRELEIALGSKPDRKPRTIELSVPGSFLKPGESTLTPQYAASIKLAASAPIEEASPAGASFARQVDEYLSSKLRMGEALKLSKELLTEGKLPYFPVWTISNSQKEEGAIVKRNSKGDGYEIVVEGAATPIIPSDATKAKVDNEGSARVLAVGLITEEKQGEKPKHMLYEGAEVTDKSRFLAVLRTQASTKGNEHSGDAKTDGDGKLSFAELPGTVLANGYSSGTVSHSVHRVSGNQIITVAAKDEVIRVYSEGPADYHVFDGNGINSAKLAERKASISDPLLKPKEKFNIPSGLKSHSVYTIEYGETKLGGKVQALDINGAKQPLLVIENRSYGTTNVEIANGGLPIILSDANQAKFAAGEIDGIRIEAAALVKRPGQKPVLVEMASPATDKSSSIILISTPGSGYYINGKENGSGGYEKFPGAVEASSSVGSIAILPQGEIFSTERPGMKRRTTHRDFFLIGEDGIATSSNQADLEAKAGITRPIAPRAAVDLPPTPADAYPPTGENAAKANEVKGQQVEPPAPADLSSLNLFGMAAKVVKKSGKPGKPGK